MTLVRMLVSTLATLTLLAPAASATAIGEENPWLERRVLNIAHQGGEIEAPSNTLFAFKTAKDKGSDVLELDVHATKDGELVVIHDTTVNRTTNGAGRIDQMTLEHLKTLDAAYWFVPDCGTCHGKPDDAYAYRGYATGEREIPDELADFEANDFRIPTLREVLEAFPRDLLNIEIKRTARRDEALRARARRAAGRVRPFDDTIVVSFSDVAMELFNVFAPDVSTATATGQATAFWASAQGPAPGAPNPRYDALQVPISLNGVAIVTPQFVERAHANGLAVHVWTINDAPTMQWLIDIGVDGIMTDRPTVLEDVLGANRVKRPERWSRTNARRRRTIRRRRARHVVSRQAPRRPAAPPAKRHRARRRSAATMSCAIRRRALFAPLARAPARPMQSCDRTRRRSAPCCGVGGRARPTGRTAPPTSQSAARNASTCSGALLLTEDRGDQAGPDGH